jgi:rubrerythrin
MNGGVKMKNIKKILEFGMAMEKNAQKFYSYYETIAQSKETQDLFRELESIEFHHYNVLNKMYESLNFKDNLLEISWVVDNSSREKNTSIFADNSDLLISPEIATDINILRMAYLIENDFATFYQNAASQVKEQNVKEFLNELASWETEHSNLFKVRYENILKSEWNDLLAYIK